MLTFEKKGYQFKMGQMPDLTVRPEPIEEWTVKAFMVRQAHHERLNLKLSRLKLEAKKITGKTIPLGDYAKIR
jgi:hypothetical protein